MPMWMRRVANGLLAATIISSISAYVFSSSKSSTSSVSRTSSMQGQRSARAMCPSVWMQGIISMPSASAY